MSTRYQYQYKIAREPRAPLLGSSSAAMLMERESHRQPIYAVAWNQVDASLRDVFASVGSNRISVYRLSEAEEGQSVAEEGQSVAAVPPHKANKRRAGSCPPPALAGRALMLQQAYRDANTDERFYCCDWGLRVAVDGESATSLLAVAGALRHIKLIDCCKGLVDTVLRGHGGDINELRFHPRRRALLLSASADESVRLWHTGLAQCLATFTGHAGHRDSVVSVDIRLDGRAFATGSIDGSIKVWSLDSAPLEARIAAADEAASAAAMAADEAAATVSAPLLVFQSPCATYDRIHYDDRARLSYWIDCVRWIGGLVLSRGTDGRAVLWQPLGGGLPPIESEHARGTELAPTVGGGADAAGDAAASVIISAKGAAKAAAKAAAKGSAKGGGKAKGKGSKRGTGDNNGAAGGDGDGAAAIASDEAPPSHHVVAELCMDATAGIWFLRFSPDLARSKLAIGNTRGEVALWSLAEFTEVGAEMSARDGAASAGLSTAAIHASSWAPAARGSGSPAAASSSQESATATAAAPPCPPPLSTFTVRAASHRRKKSKGAKSQGASTFVVRCTALSPDGRYVVCGCEDGSVCVGEA